VNDNAVDPITETGGAAGDNAGYSVALSGNRAIIGAPQLLGRSPYQLNAINTNGNGHVFVRDVSPPLTVTLAEDQQTLIAGARANVLTGTLDGLRTADLKFFDINRVELATGSAADQITVGSDGLTAFGLADFRITTGAGNDNVELLSANVTPPALGSFVPSGLFVGDVPQYELLSGRFQRRWRQRQQPLHGRRRQQLDAGAGLADRRQWRPGAVGGDARHPRQRRRRQQPDQRQRLGRQCAPRWRPGFRRVPDCRGGTRRRDAGRRRRRPRPAELDGHGSGRHFRRQCGQVNLGSSNMGYSGIEVLRLSGGSGDDLFVVNDSAASSIQLDGEAGSDTYRVFAGSRTTQIVVHDGGPVPAASANIDTLEVPASSSHGSNTFTVGGKTVLFDSSIEEFGLSLFNRFWC
jgi:hypothetical protein